MCIVYIVLHVLYGCMYSTMSILQVSTVLGPNFVYSRYFGLICTFGLTTEQRRSVTVCYLFLYSFLSSALWRRGYMSLSHTYGTYCIFHLSCAKLNWFLLRELRWLSVIRCDPLLVVSFWRCNSACLCHKDGIILRYCYYTAITRWERLFRMYRVFESRPPAYCSLTADVWARTRTVRRYSRTVEQISRLVRAGTVHLMSSADVHAGRQNENVRSAAERPEATEISVRSRDTKSNQIQAT